MALPQVKVLTIVLIFLFTKSLPLILLIIVLKLLLLKVTSSISLKVVNMRLIMSVLIKINSWSISYVVLRFSSKANILRLVLIPSIHEFKAVGVLDVLHIFAWFDLEVEGFVLSVVLIFILSLVFIKSFFLSILIFVILYHPEVYHFGILFLQRLVVICVSIASLQFL